MVEEDFLCRVGLQPLDTSSEGLNMFLIPMI